LLVDKIFLARDRTNSSGSSPSASPSATLTMNAGVIDANHVILGYQGQGNNQNASGANFCQATLNVNGGTFRVNQTMELGYTTAAAGHTTDSEQTYGRFTVSGAGATVLASNITVGGVTKISASRPATLLNNITISSGGKLILTNGAASSDKMLNVLTVSGGTLTLHADIARTTPYVYTTNLTTSGSNTLQLASVTGYAGGYQRIDLISYDTAGASFNLLTPPGLFGYLDNDTANKLIYAVVSTNPPKNLVWSGGVNGNWNNSTINWQGGQTFFPGDSPRFDDSASGTRTVTIVGAPTAQAVGGSGMTVSNAGPAYTFSGSGIIAGTVVMTKSGTAGLTMSCVSQLPVALQNGSVTVTASGAIGQATLSTGTTLTSAGSVNGVASAGTVINTGAIVANGANISGGSLVNSGTVTGALAVASGAVASNNFGGLMITSGNCTVATNASLVNNGVIINGSGSLIINGTLTGTGRISDVDFFNPATPAAGVDGRLAVSGTLSPGNSIGTFIVEGRFDLNQNANLIVECSISGSATNYDVVGCDYWGAIRGNLVMTNVGPNPFAVGQSFLIVSNNFGLLNDKNVNPNADFKFVPPSPGLGMLWDRTDVFTNGLARIIGIASTPTSLGTSVSSNQMTLTWPSTHIGWELQSQTRALTNGISTLAADWSVVLNSQATNEVVVTINTNNGAVFYRLAHPAFN
jgi:hypothetical protein